VLEQFRARLKEDGRSLLWFHKKYLFGKIGYIYFTQQAGGFSPVNEAVEKAIQTYLDEG